MVSCKNLMKRYCQTKNNFTAIWLFEGIADAGYKQADVVWKKIQNTRSRKVSWFIHAESYDTIIRCVQNLLKQNA